MSPYVAYERIACDILLLATCISCIHLYTTSLLATLHLLFHEPQNTPWWFAYSMLLASSMMPEQSILNQAALATARAPVLQVDRVMLPCPFSLLHQALQSWDLSSCLKRNHRESTVEWNHQETIWILEPLSNPAEPGKTRLLVFGLPLDPPGRVLEVESESCWR